MGVGVKHADDFDTFIFSAAEGAQQHLGIDFVHLGRGRDVRARHHVSHFPGGGAEQEAAPLHGQRPDTGSDHCFSLGRSHGEHALSVPPRGVVCDGQYDGEVARAKQMQERRAKAKADSTGDKVVATNRRARHDYDILETFECGMVLTGSEVKSLREGKAQIAEAYARIDDGELWLFQSHVPPWAFAVGFGSHDPDRKRKLLLHRQEINRIHEKTKTQPLTIVPLKMYFKEGRAKIEIGLAKGRKMQDRREAIKERDAQREIARTVRNAEKFS